MAQTYTSIKSAVITSDTASVNFTSISQSYTDLVLMASIDTTNTSGTAYLKLTFNGDTTATYYSATLKNYTATTASRDSTFGGNFIDGSGYLYVNDTTQASNMFSNFEMYIGGYTTSLKKPYNAHAFQNNNTSEHYIARDGGFYGSATAISSILIELPSSGSFISGTRFDLYGVLKA